MAISSAGGVILGKAIHPYPAIATYQPVINGVAGESSDCSPSLSTSFENKCPLRRQSSFRPSQPHHNVAPPMLQFRRLAAIESRVRRSQRDVENTVRCTLARFRHNLQIVIRARITFKSFSSRHPGAPTFQHAHCHSARKNSIQQHSVPLRQPLSICMVHVPYFIPCNTYKLTSGSSPAYCLPFVPA